MGEQATKGGWTTETNATGPPTAPGTAPGGAARATTPVIRGATTLAEGERALVVREHRGHVELVSGNVVLLSSAALETERAFGRLAARLSTASLGRTPHILLGGLGFGATARGVLDAVTGPIDIVVVEKVAAVERLVRTDLAHFAEHVIEDPRIRVLVEDVGDVIRRSEAVFDLILMDIDNGPHWASFRSNARMYTRAGLQAARRALRPAGSFAVWSGYPAPAFAAALRTAGFVPTTIPLVERGRVRARAYVGTRHDAP